MAFQRLTKMVTNPKVIVLAAILEGIISCAILSDHYEKTAFERNYGISEQELGRIAREARERDLRNPRYAPQTYEPDQKLKSKTSEQDRPNINQDTYAQ